MNSNNHTTNENSIDNKNGVNFDLIVKDDDNEADLLINKNSMNIDLEEINSTTSKETELFDDIFKSNYQIGKASLKIGGEFMIVMLSNAIKDFLLFIFCRSKGIDVVEAATALSVIYDMFCVALPWSLTTLYMYNSAEAYSSGNFRLLGILTNKMNFILLVLGVTVSILFCSIIEPIYNHLSDRPGAVQNLSEMIRWTAIGTPFFYIQMCSTRYLGTIEKGYIVSICNIITVGSQILVLVVVVNILGNVNLGVGMGFSSGFIIMFALQYIYIYIFKPHPESVINIFEDVFKNILEFTCNAFIVGVSVFINYLTLDFIPFLALIVGDKEYTIMNIFIVLIISFSLVSDSLNVGNNIIINYVIGKKDYGYIKNVYLVNLVITLCYSLVVGGLLLGFFYYALSLFNDKEEFINEASEYRVLFFFSAILASIHNINSETVLACGGEKIGLYIMILGRLIITFSLSLIMIFTTGKAVSSLLISFIIGQSITLSLNIGYLIYLFKDCNKQLQINMLMLSTRYEDKPNKKDEFNYISDDVDADNSKNESISINEGK